MSEIRIQKIDGQEFVPYNDYKELKEWYENLIRANKKASEHIDELEEENKKLEENRSIEIKTCNRYREKCDKLKEEKQELEYLWDINEELKEENQKLKEDNQKLREQIVQQNRCYEQQFENWFPKYELLNHNK